MIEIKFEAANGADLRKEMLALLGLESGEIVHTHIIQNHGIVLDDEPADVKEEVKSENTVSTIKRTRKAKDVVEPSNTTEPAKDETIVNEPPVDTNEPAKVETPATDAAPAAITAEDLTRKAVELGRSGKRDALLAVLDEKFGGATIAKKDGKPQLTVDQYEAVMEAFNAIG